MNLDQVSTYIREPFLLGPEQVPALKQLCDDFPYTAIYPLLYLTALANAKSPLLEEALTKYAYRLSDRTRLYNLVECTTDENNSFSETSSVATAQSEKEPVNPQITEGESEKLVGETASASDSEEIADSQHEPADLSEEKPEFEYFTTASSVEQDYFLLSDERNDAENETVTGKNEAVLPAEETHATGPRSFMDWIKSNGHNAPGLQPARESALSKNEIIDRFIETQPTITRQKAEFYSPPKKAKESLKEETMPVSETLARIFTAQGNYPKAIHVYHQLMLANPEKKTFFAVQIEELKKKLTI